MDVSFNFGGNDPNINRLINNRDTMIIPTPSAAGDSSVLGNFLKFIGLGSSPRAVDSRAHSFGQGSIHEKSKVGVGSGAFNEQESYVLRSYEQINNIAKKKKGQKSITFKSSTGKFTVDDKSALNYEQNINEKSEDGTLAFRRRWGSDYGNREKWESGTKLYEISTNGHKRVNRKFDTSQNADWDPSKPAKVSGRNTHDAINKLGVLKEGASNWHNQELTDKAANITHLNAGPDDLDTVPFYVSFFSKLDPISGMPTDEMDLNRYYLVFRAVVTGFTDNHAGQFNPTRFAGRPDKVWTYAGHDRTINMTLTLAAQSRQEMKPMWEKINALMGLTAPDMANFEHAESPGVRMLAPMCRVTLGDYLQQAPMILQSCNASYDDKFTWEIDKGMRVPQQCKLSLSWAWIGDQFPRMGAKFVQFDRGSQEGVKKGS